MDRTVLLVDDERAWCMSVRMLLKRKLGIQNIIECYDSREVMRLLAEHAVDLVLLDYSMPYLDGEEVLAQIQRKYANMLNVIVLSGQEHRHKEKNCADLGATVHNKAEGTESILATVAKAMEGGRFCQVARR